MALAVSTQLNVLERKSLRKCEARIKEGMATFVDVGNALAEIRDGKLYREGHKTFDAYCKERWEITPQYAKRLVNASKTTEALKSETMVSLLPANERQAKELVGLQPEAAAEVMETVAAEGPVTAAKIRETVTKVTLGRCPNCGGTEVDEDGDCAKCHEPEVAEQLTDDAGKPVPEHLRAAFTAVPEFTAVSRDLTAIRKRVATLAEGPAGVWLEVRDVMTHIKDIQHALKFGRPWAVCRCKNGCQACRQSGFLNRNVFERVEEKA